jgi:hypothetical protein
MWLIACATSKQERYDIWCRADCITEFVIINNLCMWLWQ